MHAVFHRTTKILIKGHALGEGDAVVGRNHANQTSRTVECRMQIKETFVVKLPPFASGGSFIRRLTVLQDFVCSLMQGDINRGE